MRELFFKLFDSSHFDTGITVTAFSVSHIIYLVLIIGGIVGGYFLLRNSTPEKKRTVLCVLVNLLVLSYLSDFFVHEFVYGTPEDPGGLNMDKLPFHICTALCPLVALAQYNKKLQWLLEPVAVLSCLTPLMYLAYPASVGDAEPWCYQVVQTMFFHGILLAWGVLSITLGVVKLDIKKCHKTAILLVALTLWAKLGNVLLEHNWFFLNEDAFYIGLVENGIIPKWSLMIINPVVIFSAVLALYGIYYLVLHIKQKSLEKSKTEKKA